MEHYSERCSDWLDKNHHIHPNKIEMEIKRFRNMLDLAQRQQETDQDNIEDLHLTVQLLEERLIRLQVSPPQTDKSVNNQRTSPTSSVTETASTWDTSSLTQHDGSQIEVLPNDIRASRKKALLDLPGIQLGTKNLKNT